MHGIGARFVEHLPDAGIRKGAVNTGSIHREEHCMVNSVHCGLGRTTAERRRRSRRHATYRIVVHALQMDSEIIEAKIIEVRPRGIGAPRLYGYAPPSLHPFKCPKQPAAQQTSFKSATNFFQVRNKLFQVRNKLFSSPQQTFFQVRNKLFSSQQQTFFKSATNFFKSATNFWLGALNIRAS